MKISKKAIHIFCVVFEFVFIALTILSFYATNLFYGFYSNTTHFAEPVNATILVFSIVGALNLVLLAATIILHIIATRSSQSEKQVARQNKIDRLQAKIDELRKDGE